MAQDRGATRRIVVVGAGGIGTGAAVRLADDGHEVSLVSRSGRGPQDPRIQQVALDITDVTALSAHAAGADAIVNAVNPSSYAQWARDWPPMARSFLTAAERSGAGLVTVSNLYGHGPGSGVMRADTPLRATYTKGKIRADMWREALAAHEAGRIRATELRASDYFGPGATKYMSYSNQFIIGPASRGRTVRTLVGKVDVPHTWAYLPDISALTAALAASDLGWGRPWLVPSAPPRTMTELAADAAAVAGRPAPKVTTMPGREVLRAVVPLLRETRETDYQFAEPFLTDASDTEATFGLQPTDWTLALKTTVEWLRQA